MTYDAAEDGRRSYDLAIAEKRKELMAPFEKLKRGHYGAILADPPWSFATWGTQVNATSDVHRHYSTMGMDSIAALPVADLAAENCVLFCWACWPSFPEALEVVKAWGFTYKTLAFNWVKGEGLPMFPDDIKDQMGMGYWTRANSEPCILATRGKPKRVDAGVRQTILSKRREHSRKPDEVYDRVVRLVPGPYVELFARQQREGWDSWGNETDKFPTLDTEVG